MAEMSYSAAGIDIDQTDAAKREMAASLATADPRVLNRIGAFASLYDARFEGYQHPVLVLKTEEPGSKQKLAFEHDRVESICRDMINHLVNDIIVMGARPLSVQDAIICGRTDKAVIARLVAGMAAACRENDCTLTGGETSIQPGVLAAGGYILTSSIVGVVEKAKIIDGSRIQHGDVVLAVPSNGLHTNGYTLVRAIMAASPAVLDERPGGESFMDVILRPHTPYYRLVRGMFDWPELHGLAHITGGGIQDNLNRILPAGCDAAIDRSLIRVLPVFGIIRRWGNVADAEMLRTFNMGVGLTAVVAAGAAEKTISHLRQAGCEAYPIGTIVPGDRKVSYFGELNW
jgi:phosphoribosylformylglycinamidine cyclo-ligase